MTTPAGDDLRRCREILPSVSRTFALTIGVLPGSLRDSVSVAYLLCRMADVLEDATGVDPVRRVDGLEKLAGVLAGAASDPAELASCLDDAQGLPIEDRPSVRLLRERGCVFRAYSALPEAEREVVSRWVQAMALGMSTYVARELRRPPGSGEIPFVLETSEDLHAYAYFVAGTVGHLLTDLFVLHLGQRAAPESRLRELAVPFGLGLQFTNILQDLAEDRRRGWSYIPEELARRHGTSARGLTDPRQRPAALRVVGDLIREAAENLDRAMEYTLLLPRRVPRVRLFCLWPTFFALRTLVRLWGEERVLTGGERVRISRPEIRRVVGITSAACLWNGGLSQLYHGERARLDRRMALRPV